VTALDTATPKPSKPRKTYPVTPEAMQTADVLVPTVTDRIDGRLMARAGQQLRLIAQFGAGVDNIDVASAVQRGITVTNTPGVLTDDTADVAMALILAVPRRLHEGVQIMESGKFDGWTPTWMMGRRLSGKRLGIIGMGRIGQGIARRAAHGFGMNVIYHNRSRLSAELEAECKATYVSKQELLKTADHLMLVVPYSAESHHTIGAAELAQMKPTATLVNIARGGIVDDAALAKALAAGQIAAAGLDVFEGEPALHPDLLTVSNVVLTPHIASSTVKTRKAMAQLAADNLVAYLTKGQALTPLNSLPGTAA
jgi:lactate dehydrogenase-like 2-hydroxyacid dehydrogenase